MAGSNRTLIGIGVLGVALLSMGATMVSLRGCDEKLDSGVTPVKIAGKTFYLEIAADAEKQYKGMGGRQHIEDDGGMIFVFPRAERREFVMRDCPIPIDILYLDGAGRVLATHTMQPETARGPNERAEVKAEDDAYNVRLKRYPSRFPSQFVVEVQAGTITKLGVHEGDLVELEAAELKKLLK